MDDYKDILGKCFINKGLGIVLGILDCPEDRDNYEFLYDSFEYTRNLDYLDESITNILFVAASKNIIDKTFDVGEDEDKKEWAEFIK